MQISKVARRYAKAFFSLAADQQLTEAVTADAKALGNLLTASDAFRMLVSSPALEGAEQSKALHRLLGDQAQALTLRFLDFLIERDRLNQLPDICLAVQNLYNEQNGILNVSLLTARGLEQDQVQVIQERLEKRFNQSVVLEIEEDASLMGGFMVIAGDEVIDLTLKTQLATIRKNILNA